MASLRNRNNTTSNVNKLQTTNAVISRFALLAHHSYVCDPEDTMLSVTSKNEIIACLTRKDCLIQSNFPDRKGGQLNIHEIQDLISDRVIVFKAFDKNPRNTDTNATEKSLHQILRWSKMHTCLQSMIGAGGCHGVGCEF
jgi:hypothetical protein